MRIIGLDVGEKRIGVAVADSAAPVAIPLGVITTNDDPLDEVARIVREQDAGELVVGMPLSLSGDSGPQARVVEGFLDGLQSRFAFPIHTWDERLSSIEADHRIGKKRGSKRGRASAATSRDAVAAAIILQAFLDSRRRSA